MIHSVRFRNFRALRDVEIALDQLTVLTGPNASGKTSVLEGIHILSRLPSTDPRFVFEGNHGVGLVASRDAEGVMELALSGTFRRKRGDLSIAFTAIEDFPFTDAYRFESGWGDRRFSVRRELHPADDLRPEMHPGGELGLGLVFGEAANLRFDLAHLAEPSYSDLATPVVGSTGRGLGAVIAELAASRPEDFARLQEALGAVIPGLTRVRLVRVKVSRPRPTGGEDPVWGHEVVFDMAGARDIPARAASEGMLRVVGLFATLLGDGRPRHVLVDRIEHAIHPSSFGELMAQLRKVLDQDPDMQIVATSDNTAFLNEVAASSVRVHCLLEDGSVRVKPLIAHREHALLASEMRSGEFLNLVGDAWVADAATNDMGDEDARDTRDITDDSVTTAPPPPAAPTTLRESQIPPPLPIVDAAVEAPHQPPPPLPPPPFPGPGLLPTGLGSPTITMLDGDDTEPQAYPAGMPPLPPGSPRA